MKIDNLSKRTFYVCIFCIFTSIDWFLTMKVFMIQEVGSMSINIINITSINQNLSGQGGSWWVWLASWYRSKGSVLSV